MTCWRWRGRLRYSLWVVSHLYGRSYIIFIFMWPRPQKIHRKKSFLRISLQYTCLYNHYRLYTTSMYSYCMCMYFHCASWYSLVTLTEVFPGFFLSCKANAWVKPAKTGHGPQSSKIFVLFCVLLYCLCVNVCCTAATGWLPNCS